MATSNIKLFDENKGNMLTDTEFNISTQRLNGLQTGVASSQLQNKAMYQASLVAYAIAQVMMQNGKNANDTDAVSAFVASLSGTMLQKVYDIATTAEAQAGVATGKWMSPALVKAAIDTLAAKANNILSSSTKALYGLDSSAVPDDVLRVLSRFQKGLGNEYVWEKTKTTYIPHWTEQTRESCMLVDKNSSFPQYIYYSDEISINENNQFVLENYKILTVTGSNYSDLSIYNVLHGKYISDPSNSTHTEATISVIKWVDGASIENSTYQILLKNSLWLLNPRREARVTVYEYLNSPDPNAYPPAVSDGYTYTPLGQLGAKTQIATGSYIGDGNYGSSNKTGFELNFMPRIVIVARKQYANHTFVMSQFFYPMTRGVTYNTNANGVPVLSEANYCEWGETFQFYGSSSSNQMNDNNVEYGYTAIG